MSIEYAVSVLIFQPGPWQKGARGRKGNTEIPSVDRPECCSKGSPSGTSQETCEENVLEDHRASEDVKEFTKSQRRKRLSDRTNPERFSLFCAGSEVSELRLLSLSSRSRSVLSGGLHFCTGLVNCFRNE